MAPAAANYYTPPTHAPQKQRGYRICDTCGAVENSSVQSSVSVVDATAPLNAKKSHWPSHKAICQHTAAQLSEAKQHPTGPSYPDENLAKYLRKFTSTHASLLGWAGFQALQLKRIQRTSDKRDCDRAELSSVFSIANTHIVPRSYVTSHDPLVAADIERREDRCRKSGGIGTLIILVQCGGISQVMPVEVDPPSKIAWDSREDWKEVLRHFVDSGRSDFKPISTTARG
ncbi:hypothetical protein EDD15DRAFT_2371016 [Pisolithus albus]|nr:hypothetical protein EDD15DRAFT_2371016 [Pisolithus albus]